MLVSAEVADATADFSCASGALDQAGLLNGAATVQCSDSDAANYGYLNITGIEDEVSTGTFELHDTEDMGIYFLAFTVQIGGSFERASVTWSSFDQDQTGTIQVFDGAGDGALSIRLELEDPDEGTALVEVSTQLD